MAIDIDYGFLVKVSPKLERLSDRITVVRGLYSIKYALKGEKNSRSSYNIADSIREIYGMDVVEELLKLPYEDLRRELRKYIREL